MAGSAAQTGADSRHSATANASSLDSRGRVEVSLREHRFGDLKVIRDLNLTVEPHTFVSILGPSGCGKTTLLRIMDGLIPPSDGSVRVNGEAVTGPPPGVAMVFQQHNLLPWRKALANVTFGLELTGVPRAEREKRGRESMAMVGLEDFQDSYPHQLSGGMQQRIGLARALCLRPSVLLMDEPFGALDAQTRVNLQDELLSIWESYKATVVFVTHSIEEAIYLSDRVVVMTGRPGQIQEDVKIDLSRPRSGQGENLRVSPEVAEYRRRLSTLLSADAGDEQQGGSRALSEE